MSSLLPHGPAPTIPRWLLIGTAICIFVPDFILLHHLTPAFRHSHQIHPAIRAMVDNPAVAEAASIVAELMRPAVSLFLALGVLRRKFLIAAAIYLVLRIKVPVLLVLLAPQVISWALAPLFLHVLALVGVIYIRHLHMAGSRVVAP